MPQIRTKVATDSVFVENMSASSNDHFFADDLVGCTVVAAVWEQKDDDDERSKALFAYFATRTLQDGVRGPKFIKKVQSSFTEASDEGQEPPEKVWLFWASDEKGDELYPEGNALVRKMLTEDAHVAEDNIVEERYLVPATGTVKVELRPGTVDPFVQI